MTTENNLFGTDYGDIFSLTLKDTKTREFKKNWEFNSNSNIPGPASIENIDADSQKEVVYRNLDHQVYAKDGKTGQTQWIFGLPTKSGKRGYAGYHAIADV